MCYAKKRPSGEKEDDFVIIAARQISAVLVPSTFGLSPFSVSLKLAAPKGRRGSKLPARRGINPIPFMSRKRGRRKSGVLALHFGAPGMGNN